MDRQCGVKRIRTDYETFCPALMGVGQKKHRVTHSHLVWNLFFNKAVCILSSFLQAGQDLSRVNKLEKADILEMTVRYLKRKTTGVQQPQSTPPPSRPDVYMAGYKQCVEQVQELLAEQWTDERRHQSGRRMVQHLEACVQRLDSLSRPPPPCKNRLSSTSSSDESSIILNPQSAPTNSTTTSCSWSEDDDIVEDEQQPPAVTTAAAMVRPARDNPRNHHTTTQFQDTPPKSMWRPW